MSGTRNPREMAFRLGGRIQNPSSRNELNDFWMDEVYLILAANGRITPWFKWQFNLNANNPPTQANGSAPLSYPSVGIQDLIAKLKRIGESPDVDQGLYDLSDGCALRNNQESRARSAAPSEVGAEVVQHRVPVV